KKEPEGLDFLFDA
nr:Chain D, GP45 recognition loop [Tequatrovirus T4]6DRT_E Chain E, GP45 recognition loop [Tequatrovirus T4]6DRT_F Chain F, GP45 recognition loop [Tequatrovirus T4]